MDFMRKILIIILVFGMLSLPATAEEATKRTGIIPYSSDFVITSQIKLNGVNVGESGIRIIDEGNMTGTFTITNNTENSKNISVLLATYTEDKKLYRLEERQIDIVSGETKSIELVYRFDAEQEYSGKIMFWRPLTGAFPVRIDINFAQNSGINAYYYDADNRLLQIDKANGTSVTFTYDNMGNMLTKAITA